MSEISNQRIIKARQITYSIRVATLFVVRAFIGDQKDFILTRSAYEIKNRDNEESNLCMKDEEEVKEYGFLFGDKDNYTFIQPVYSDDQSTKTPIYYKERENSLNAQFGPKIKKIIFFDSTERDNITELTQDEKCKILSILAGSNTKIYKYNEGETIQNLVIAVNEEIIDDTKGELNTYFKLSETDDSFYNKLELSIRDWYENGLSLLNEADKDTIDFNDIDEFFQRNIKQFTFNVNSPVKSFLGRNHEMNEIQKAFQKYPCLAIYGSFGIGKTQLVRGYIKEYGESTFYGRVLSINAENEASVRESFNRYNRKFDLELEDDIVKSFEVIIEYFKALKVLFVFENCNEIQQSEEYNKFFRYFFGRSKYLF